MDICRRIRPGAGVGKAFSLVDRGLWEHEAMGVVNRPWIQTLIIDVLWNYK